MLNCITTDMTRVLKRKSVIIWFVIELLLIVGGAVGVYFLNKYGFNFTYMDLVSILVTASSVIIGIPVFLAVFKDDLQSKAMQNTIGMGMRRDQLVWARFIETSIIYAILLVILLVVCYAVGIPFGMTWGEFLKLSGTVAEMLFKMICYTAISMIVVFGTLNTSFAQSLYLLLTLGVVEGIINAFSLLPFFIKHNINLSYLTINGVLGLARSKTFALAPLMWVVLVAAFVVLPIIITVMVFRKKELDL